MSKHKKPTQALLAELKPIFAKHGWNEFAIGAPAPASALVCPPGKVPTDVTIKLPNGKTVTRTVCV